MNIFVLYAPEDAHYWQQLQKHLAELQRQNVISTYHEGSMSAGSTIAAEMQTYLDRADMVLLLVSPDFIASDRQYHYAEQAQTAQKRIVPIIVRPCMWQDAAWGKFAALPTHGKAISQYDQLDDGFFDVARGLRKLIEPDWVEALSTEIPPDKHSVTHHNTSVDKSNNNQTNVTGEGNTVIQGVSGSTIHIHQATETKHPNDKNDDIPQKTPLTRYLAGVALLVGILAGLAELSGYSLRDVFRTRGNTPIADKFAFTVYAKNEMGELIPAINNHREIVLSLPDDELHQPIDAEGKATFRLEPKYLDQKTTIGVWRKDETQQPYQNTHADSTYVITKEGKVNIVVVLGNLDKMVGIVTDFKTKQPIANAEIMLTDIGTFDIRTNTDTQGRFVLQIPKADQRKFQNLVCTKQGYNSEKISEIPVHTQQDIAIQLRVK